MNAQNDIQHLDKFFITQANVYHGRNLQIEEGAPKNHNFPIPFAVPKRSHKLKIIKPVEDCRTISKKSKIQPTILKKKSKLSSTNGMLQIK